MKNATYINVTFITVKVHWFSNIQFYLNRHVQVYYFSLEFLLGRMLKNNLKSLGIYDVVKNGLNDLGVDINDIEDLETDPGLGNGGLGRLAACFMDSIATLNYAGSGNTIRYKNGLFKQLIIDNEQIEVPDQWLRIGNPWEVRKAEKTGTAPVLNQINAIRITLITGVALNTAIRGSNSVSIFLLLPARIPKTEPDTTIIKKLSRARRTVAPKFE